MKNIILSLLIGLIVGFPISVYAKTIINPIERISSSINKGNLYTTKVTTEEGIYRIFAYTCGYGAGITAIKVK
jgi:hypothetical protein